MTQQKEVNEGFLNGVKRTYCKVYSRVAGFFSPTDSWNDGKKQEFKHRKTFKVSK